MDQLSEADRSNTSVAISKISQILKSLVNRLTPNDASSDRTIQYKLPENKKTSKIGKEDNRNPVVAEEACRAVVRSADIVCTTIVGSIPYSGE